MSHLEGDADRVFALIEKINVAMVVIHDRHGDRIRARPMAARAARDENAVYFLTDAYSGKVRDVEHNQDACLAFTDSAAKTYVSVTGRAILSNDREKIRQLWSTADKAFWSDENDPSIRVLRVTAEEAEYWESSSNVAAYFKVMLARLTGDQANLHENAKVSLPSAETRRGAV